MIDKPPFVFFIDMDGVLNNPRVCVSRPTSQRGDLFSWIDPISVNYINCWADMVEEHGDTVNLVMSSTWRSQFDNWASLSTMFSVMGVTPRVHEDFKTRPTGMTIDGVRDIRGFQVRDWLENHPEVTKWMIIDDDSDFTDEQKKRFVHTSSHDGILLDHHIKEEEVIKGIYDGSL